MARLSRENRTNRPAARARRPAKVISDVRADLADAAALAVTDMRGGPLDMPRSFRADRAVGWNKPDVKVSRAKALRAKRAAAARARARAKGKASARKATSKKRASARG